MNSSHLLEYLSAKTSPDGFHAVSVRENPDIEGLEIIGCLQKKTLSAHGAVCVVTISDAVSDVEKALVDLRKALHKSLKPSFWRGLGLGMIVYAKDPISESVLSSVVDYAAKRTTLTHWVLSVNGENDSIAAAHTWMNVSTSCILIHTFDAFQIHEAERRLLIVKPEGVYKTLFRLNGFWKES